MKKFIEFILVFCLTVGMVGCKLKEFSDISNEPRVSKLIGIKCISKKELFIYGISNDPDYKKVVDDYTVMEPPGIGGSEVVSKDVLPIGTSFKIVRVERCNNCFPFKANERLVIELLSNSKFKDRPVTIDSDRIDIEKTDALVRM
jgi:hypothetical protein